MTESEFTPTPSVEIQRVLDALVSLGCTPVAEGSLWASACPSHEGGRPGLTISQGSAGHVFLRCADGCPTSRIVERLGLTRDHLIPGRIPLSGTGMKKSGTSRKGPSHSVPITAPRAIPPDPGQVESRSSAAIRLSQVECRAVAWLWRDRVAKGAMTVLDGDPGVGKSMLVASVVACLTSGRALPGGDPQPATNVVLCDLENDPGNSLAPRIKAAGGDPHRVILLNSVANGSSIDLANDEDMASIEEEVRRHAAGLLVIDPLMAVLGRGVDSFKDQDIRRVLARLSKVASDTGCAILLVRHLNKSLVSRAIYRGGGSIGIIGAARIGLLMTRSQDEPRLRLLATTKNNLGREAKTLRFSMTGSDNEAPTLVFEGESDDRADEILSQTPERAGAVEEAIGFLQMALASGPRAAKEIEAEARSLGLSLAAVRRARKMLAVKAVPEPRADGRGVRGWFLHLPAELPDLGVQGVQSQDLSKLVNLVDSADEEGRNA